MEDKEPEFESQHEALRFFRSLAHQYKKRFHDSQRDLEELEGSSRDLEAELEAQLGQLEAKNKDLAATNHSLHQQCDRLQAKLSAAERECRSLRDESTSLQREREELRLYVRKLEQKNDDFERATRASLMSLEDFDTRLNQAIERNAFLENELDEKENMAELIQRLKDEARDLKQELILNEAVRCVDTPPPTPSPPPPPSTPQRRLSEAAEAVHRLTLRRSSTQFLSNAASIVPHSAMNILGDLLKKVGVLESKLQSCRDCLKDGSDGEKPRVSIAITATSRVTHMNGSTVPSLQDFIPLSV